MCDRLGYDLGERIGYFAVNGVVYIDKDCVILAEEQDGVWFIWLASGRNCLFRFVSLAPHPLPKVAWARELRGRVQPKTYRFDRVARIIKERNRHGWRKQTADTDPAAADPAGE